MKMRKDWTPRTYRLINFDKLLAELNSEKYERQESLKSGDTVAETDFAAGAIYGVNFAISALKSEVNRTSTLSELLYEEDTCDICTCAVTASTTAEETAEEINMAAPTKKINTTTPAELESSAARAEKRKHAAICAVPCEYECSICCRDCDERKNCDEACDGFNENGMFAPCPWREEVQ